MNNEIKYLSKLTLMLLRCGYLEDQNGKTNLTLKGWGYIKWPTFWRIVNEIRLKISKRYRYTMMALMEKYATAQIKKHTNLYKNDN